MLRICVDYRALNKLTKPNAYPLPQIDECVTDAPFTLRFAFIFEVVIIRYDKVARDRERVHMIITRA